MSYCRWSSDNFMCDVYVYEDVNGGWTTHMAGNRPMLPPIPELPLSWLPKINGEFDSETRTVRYPNKWRAAFAYVVCTVWVWSHRIHFWSLSLIPRRDIGLPHDGESFNDPTPSDCADRLEMLRRMGYRVPQRVIDALRSEQLETPNPPQTPQETT